MEAVMSKRGELWRDCSLNLQHEDAPAWSSFRVSHLLVGKCISAMQHAPFHPT